MKINVLMLALLYFLSHHLYAQNYPAYGKEIPLTINGLTFDAMEPFISADSSFLFFNSLNNGTTTSLYYASRINDSTYNYIGPLNGANQTITPRLDAVASSDSANRFFWVSTRNYPAQYDNYFHGVFNGTDIINIGRVHGTFYIYSPGWLIMDASVNYGGSLLYYCNAYFNNCGSLPCISKLGIAQRLDDSTFNKLDNSDYILQNINDTNYLVYAPSVTKDGLELYYTRILKSNPVQTEICVSVRSTTSEIFSLPYIIYASSLLPEAPTITTGKSMMYYHKKEGGLYRIFLRYRTSSNDINEIKIDNEVKVFPIPSTKLIKVDIPDPDKAYSIKLFSLNGKELLSIENKNIIDLSNVGNGIYLMKIIQKDKVYNTKIVKQ